MFNLVFGLLLSLVVSGALSVTGHYVTRYLSKRLSDEQVTQKVIIVPREFFKQ